ncbi:hypothetical protein DM02DRAFT_613749 [Periconia macrospinosa]|uniref:Uncharacterized protein n=1 Tax=Periconia macrospinosa TaxID=97972 RepID=A0A2V1DVQ7_9PLEO|nr:hypothetical protein DM02DRAFT_613749 [Periconia macrospinosa]
MHLYTNLILNIVVFSRFSSTSPTPSSTGQLFLTDTGVGQIRLVMGYLYWVHQGRWTNSPTAIRRVKIPASAITSPIPPDQHSEIVGSESNTDGIFFEKDLSGDTMTLSIKSFAVDERSGRLWIPVGLKYVS